MQAPAILMAKIPIVAVPPPMLPFPAAVAATAIIRQITDQAEELMAPVLKYLHETPTRVPFSDWYDTKTGRYVFFIARSVQGGVYMPFLTRE